MGFDDDFNNSFNFADDTTPYSSIIDIDETVYDVEHDCFLLVELFLNDHMTLSSSKCYLLVSDYKDDLMFVKKKLLIRIFLNPNLTTVRLYGCSVVGP